ncbi:MAG: hypothetical protein HZB38_04870 [Planctomycetes bacterium]|nr:hypothetical protein [Planctomycetota bacterium]
MKSLALILEGAVTAPAEVLGGRTLLQAATHPELDRLARVGRLGCTFLTPSGWPVRAETALLSCMSCDPKEHPAGRAALEAAALGIEYGPRDAALVCSFVTVVDGVLRDPAPAGISPAETAALADLASRQWKEPESAVHPGQGSLAVAIWRNAGRVDTLATTSPDELVDRAIAGKGPTGRGSRSLTHWMTACEKMLADCELNAVRRDLGENPVTNLWVWGEGPRPKPPRFRDRFGCGAAVIPGSTLMRGVARVLRTELVPAATASDETLGHHARGALAALERQDLVALHLPLADIAGSISLEKLASAMQRIDSEVVAPLAAGLASYADWRMMVLTTQRTEGGARIASPFLMASAGSSSNRGEAFDELHAAEGELRLERGCDLMEYFLRTEGC